MCGTAFAANKSTQIGECMKKKDLIKKIAQLETINDQLSAEIEYLDNISRELGFINGITTLKSAAYELLKEQEKNNDADGYYPPYEE